MPINQSQIERQDFVDGSIHELLETLAGCKLPWNPEYADAVRAIVCDTVCEVTEILPQEFYFVERFSDVFPKE